MEVVFTCLNRESIVPGSRDFGKLTAFFKDRDIKCTILTTLPDEEELQRHRYLFMGSPTSRYKSSRPSFKPSELEILRNYVYQGGNLFIAFKFGGGDRSIRGRLRTLFSEIQPNNDEVIDFKCIQKVSSKYSCDLWKAASPIIHLSITHPSLRFNCTILYDSGCTFSTDGKEEFTIEQKDIKDNLVSLMEPPNTRDELNGRLRTYVGSEDRLPLNGDGSLIPLAGPILVHKRIGKGTVLYWGARWSFSDDYWDSEDNAEFFGAIMKLFLRDRELNDADDNSWKS